MPKIPESGPIQSAITSCGMTAARKPDPTTPMSTRGISTTKSREPSQAPSRNSALLRTAAVSASKPTSPHRMMAMTMPMTVVMSLLTPQAGRGHARQQAGDDWQWQRDQDAPGHELGTEEWQLPDQGAVVAKQVPGGDEGDRGSDVGAEHQERTRHRVDRERPTRQHRTHRHGDQDANQPRLAADHARHHLARQ